MRNGDLETVIIPMKMNVEEKIGGGKPKKISNKLEYGAKIGGV